MLIVLANILLVAGYMNSLPQIQGLLHIMMIPPLKAIVLCALMPWTVMLLPKLLVPKWV